MKIRDKYELLMVSISLIKENDVQTEKTEFSVTQGHVSAGEPGYAAITNNAKKTTQAEFSLRESPLRVQSVF